jgi:DNA-binding NarL/FixJ family response regulator
VTSAARCLVADDHPALTAAISQRLEAAGYAIVGPAATGRAAGALAPAARPEAAVVDNRVPEPAGAELVTALRRVSPHTTVCVYTADADEELAQGVLAAGATAVVLKESPLADLVHALAAARAGRTYLDPGLLAGRRRTGKLTERELDVLRLLAEGLPHEEIGRRLGIGSETVRTHLRKASERLGASTRTQAVATALRLGLIA